MYSRAHLLIDRDYGHFMETKPWGIEAHPLKEDNIFEWTAKVLSLKDTIWEGGVFRLYLKFDEFYNSKPPEVCFHTIPFHPNVDMITGKPCVDFLDDHDQWQEKYSLTTILITIQMMLSDPVLESAVNLEAVSLLKHSPHAYKQMVQECVTASQRVEAGMSPHHEGPVKPFAGTSKRQIITPFIAKPSPPPKKASKLSFDDYHRTWAGIATSKVNYDAVNPLLNVLKDNPSLEAAHFGLPLGELQLQMSKQIEEHNSLMYGKFRSSQSEPPPDLKQAKIDHINRMRKIYLQPRTPKRTPIDGTDDLGEGEIPGGQEAEEEMWEEEVDDLVAWTNKLDADML